MVSVWVRRSWVGRPEAMAVLAVLLPVLVMLAMGLWGLDRGGMWRDEGVTFQVARRSVPQIWQLLHSADAVHGLYYLLMHPVLAPHPGEVALRLPSVCAAAATAGLVAALGVRLCRPRVGLWAGLLYAVTPMTGHFAQEGRSYALVAAGAAGATWLLVRAMTVPSARAKSRTWGRAASRYWWAYGTAVAVTCLLHELAVLLLFAHAGTLALARVPARVWRAWGCAAGAVVLALVPLALVSHAQSAQVAWLPRPGLGSVARLLAAFTGPERLLVVPHLVLIALALALWRPFARRGEPSLQAVALPLMVVPPAVLMTVSQFWPLYDDRYVLYALAGAPLLAAAGAERLVSLLPRLRLTVPTGARVTLIGALAVTLGFAFQLPLFRLDRTPGHRADNLATVSATAGRELRPGDPVLFLPSIVRRSALAYPNGFRGVRDVALSAPGPSSGTLYGQEAAPSELRRRLSRLDHVWLVAEPFATRPTWTPDTPTERLKLTLVEEEFVPLQEITRGGVTLRLYIRRPPRAQQDESTL